MKTLIKNVHVLTMDPQKNTYENGYILLEEDTITAVGSMSEKEWDEQRYDQVIDGQNAIALPGMINSHTHIGMIPFRSLGDDCPDRLRKLLFPLEKACMTEKLAYHSAKYAIAEMLLSGITTFMDMYYFENELAKAADEMKARAILGETIVDFPSCDAEEPHGGLAYAKQFIPKWLGHERIIPAVAPHAPNTNTTEALIEANRLSELYNIPLTLHLCEMDYEMDYFQENCQMTPVEYLESIGLLSERLVAAHCIHMNDHDLDLLKKYGVSVAHCIGANTKSAKGVARISDMLERDIPVGLGTDGPSSGNTLDLFTQMKLVADFHKTSLKDRSAFPAIKIVELATIGGAKALGLDKKIGSLETGKKADIVLIETDSVNMFPVFDPYAVLVYSANAGNVRDVFISGEAVVRNKLLVHAKLSSLRDELETHMNEFNIQAKIHSENL